MKEPATISKSRFLILGAGAIGCLFGGKLTHAGHEVLLVGREAQSRAINELGLILTGETKVHLRVPAMSELARAVERMVPDFILITVKAYDTEIALRQLHPYLTNGPWSNTPLVSLQNGLDNLTLLGRELGRDRVMGGLTSHGARVVEWGQVSHNGLGYTVVGEMEEAVRQRTRILAQAFDNAGFATDLCTDMEAQVWMKGMVNCAINPVAALANVTNGALEHEPLRELSKRVCEEAAEVALARNIKLPTQEPWKRVLQVIQQTGTNRCSMLQDLDRGKRTEIGSINGTIVKLGRSLGISTPINDTLVKLIRGLEAQYL